MNFMSLFLNAAESETAPPGWMRTASFKLWVINQQDPSRSIQKGAAQAPLGLGTLKITVLGIECKARMCCLCMQGRPHRADCMTCAVKLTVTRNRKKVTNKKHTPQQH